VFPTNYAANVVACKLWGLTGSPTESILTLALFNKLCHFYDGWICRVYSEHEYRQALAEQKVNGGCFVLVPQWSVNQVGLVDLGVFIPGLNHHRPIVVVECDGHHFHERTVEQASKDRRRLRNLQRLGIPVLPFTGTDVVRSSEEFAQEIAEFIDGCVNRMERRWFHQALANGVSFAGHGIKYLEGAFISGAIQEAAMKPLLFILAIGVAYVGIGNRAEAQNYPWCAYYDAGTDGGTNCGFTTFEQCMATASGLGSNCQPNTQYQPPPGPHSTLRVQRHYPH
jgi:hypothetical protein